MEKSVQKTLIITGAIVFLALIGLYMFSGLLPTNTITANGQATITAEPDLVGIYFNVQTTADTAQEAKDENSEIIDDVITSLLKLRLERKDIQTQNFNVYPQYNWKNRNREITGYQATHSLRIEIPAEDIDKIGKIIDAGVDAGALINSINFELTSESQNQYKAQALEQATQDARIKAESIASGLGKNLGRVIRVSSSNFNYSPWRLYEATAGGTINAEDAKIATTDIQPGDQDIRASVNVVYKIR